MAKIRSWPKRLMDLGVARCRTKRELKNGYMTLPAGSLGFVQSHGNGWHLLIFTGDPCSCCGVKPHISRLSKADVELLDLEAMV